MNSINVVNAVNNTKTPAPIRGFQDLPYFPERNYTISGTTVDVNGAVLGGCIVKLFYTASDVIAQQTTSHATLGTYSFNVDKTVTFYTVEYKAGPPDVYGSSVNTLAGA